jgi:curli biogenesis system outer membrane secretion channel CsgG
MLVTALVHSNRFSVVERQNLRAILQEQYLSQSRLVDRRARVRTGRIKGADLLIVGAVTEFEPNSGGMIGGGVVTNVGIVGGFKRAYLAIDLRIIDTETTEVLSSAKIEGSATDIAMGGVMAVGGLGVGLAPYKRTPMEKAIRICIANAVGYLANTVPRRYFRYGSSRGWSRGTKPKHGGPKGHPKRWHSRRRH